MRHLLLTVVLGLILMPAQALAGTTLELAGTYASGLFDESAAEIVAFDPETKRAFVVNAHEGSVDVIDLADIANPALVTTIAFMDYGDGVNSVSFCNGMLAVAVQGASKQDNGRVVVCDADGNALADFEAGALPDMVAFTPDGNYILCANEGEPNGEYSIDPEGSVTIIDISGGLDAATVAVADFTAFNGQEAVLNEQGVRISHPGSSAAQDIEPEYIAVAPDSKTAFVALQENNAIAVVDVASATVTNIFSLGLKDWAGLGLTLDASNKDDAINMQSWPVLGCYMPDAIAAYEAGGTVYVVTANEGDSREYDTYVDEERVKDAVLDPEAFPNAAELQDEAALGRIKFITDLSDTDGDGDLDRIVGFGGRSFSIYSADGEQVFDSGDDFETIIAERYPEFFNTTDDESAFDDRSDDKGPEPEGVALGVVGGKTYAFIGLERMGGVMIYDITDPSAPVFQDYVLNRNFAADPATPEAGDLAPEGMYFVSADQSPSGTPLLITGCEMSGTTTVYEIVQ